MSFWSIMSGDLPNDPLRARGAFVSSRFKMRVSHHFFSVVLVSKASMVRAE
jgi:hypothetical protein